MADQPLESGDRALQLVVDSIRDYAIFRLDPGGHIASWNLGAQLIKGYSADEIVGSSLSRFYTEDDRAPDARSGCSSALAPRATSRMKAGACARTARGSGPT